MILDKAKIIAETAAAETKEVNTDRLIAHIKSLFSDPVADS